MTQKREPGTSLRPMAMLATVGLTLALSVAVGGAIGYFLDQKLHTNWLVILGALFGVAAGFKQLMQTVTQVNREEEAAERERRQGTEREGRTGPPLD